MNRAIQILIVFLFPLLLHAQENTTVIYLWQHGAPGFESRKIETEHAKDCWVKNIHSPSLTLYLPAKEKANGAAVIICPGGGHCELVFNSEGKDAADYFNSIGVTAFVLKYRLFREEGTPYTQEHTLQDGHRAVRLVRQQAAAWNIDTSRIGLTGFSAGGELAGWVAFNSAKENLAKPNSINQQKYSIDFLILVYPVPLAVPGSIQKDAPPLFMVAANDDECCSEPIVKLLQLYRNAKVKSEVHLYAQEKHAFNIGKRSVLKSINTWPQRMADWLSDNGYLNK